LRVLGGTASRPQSIGGQKPDDQDQQNANGDEVGHTSDDDNTGSSRERPLS
jgi:hypothetical protein